MNLQTKWAEIVKEAALETKQVLLQEASVIKIEDPFLWQPYKVVIAINEMWFDYFEERKKIIERSCQKVLNTEEVKVTFILR